ncbi:MAG: radical SAM protein [Anaerolineae bacterium]|nr:radical SAM protein [Anaerolineae bacterium]
MDDEIRKLKNFSQFMAVETAEEKALLPSGPRGQSCTFLQKNVEATDISLQDELPIHMAALPNGKRVAMLKTMLTSACERNCYYCAFRSKRDFQRQTFKPDEMARTFMQLYQKKLVEGIFLSSGMAGGGVRTQDRLLATAEILRVRYNFKGYIHLKLMPGSEREQVKQAMRFSDRVSVNLEAPNNRVLTSLAPEKRFMEELLQPLRWVEDVRKNESPSQGWNGHWSSSTTQFVVGGADENDVELLATSSYLMRKLKLSRVYFSGFNPVSDTPLQDHPALNPWREHRLYQASFLLRDYGFDPEDLPFEKAGFLPLDTDPKLAWARANLSDTPLEINRADYQQLLRIPGIGPVSARRIISARIRHPLHGIEDLKNTGAVASRAAPFILMQGKRCPGQLSLF